MRIEWLGKIGLEGFLDSGDNRLGNRESMATPVQVRQAAGYLLDHSADLADPHVRQELSGSAIRGFLKLIDKWQLTEAQARGLLGGIASSTFHDWKTTPAKQKLSQDVLVRISLLVGIFKALHTYFGQPLADQWITLGNNGPIFAGVSPLDYMLRHGQPGMVQVRGTLDAWSSGR